jgi:hypothetical protein
MNRSHPSLRPLLLALLAFSASACPVLAQTPSPTVIPFQGRLTNQQNVPYAEGKYTLTFNLYNEAVGGTTVWTERHEQVGVINGTVNVFLGSIQTITSVDFSTVKHLGITIDADANPLTADPEMVPRQMIIPAFWAKNSENSNKLAGADWSSVVVNAAGAPSNNPSSGFINGGKLLDGSLATSKLAAGSVQTSLIQTGAVNSDKILDDTIVSADIKDGTIQGVDVADSTIGLKKLAVEIAVFQDQKPTGTGGGAATQEAIQRGQAGMALS